MAQHASTPPPTRRREAGFSLVEVLIASLILLFVALGLVPLFSMATSSNLQGLDNTKVANFARERLEQLEQEPFNADTLTILAGTERVWTEYYDEATKSWQLLMTPTPPIGSWFTRRTVVRQFRADDIATPISFDDALVDPTIVQMKEITVFVDGTRKGGGGLGAGKRIAVRAYKSL